MASSEALGEERRKGVRLLVTAVEGGGTVSSRQPDTPRGYFQLFPSWHKNKAAICTCQCINNKMFI